MPEMKASLRIVVAAAALLLVGSAPVASAQIAPTVFTDFVKKGKGELDNFDYAAAITTWNQLLAQGLSKQQRVDAMQLLAATLFPNDSAQQRATRDSAVTVIRQLVTTMGIRRMVVKDVSHPALDALYASTAAAVEGGTVAIDSERDVVALVSEGYSLDDILFRVNIDCNAFAFEDLELNLRSNTRMRNALPPALKRTCSQIFVESDPPNSNLTVGTRDYGNVPERGFVRLVAPEKSVEIAVAKGQARQTKVVELPQGKQLQARFFLPRDTILWPATKSVMEIADELRIWDSFRPSTPQPVAPVKPSGMGAFATGMIWGLIGGAAGFAVGQFVPAMGCNVSETVPAGRTARWKGKTYASGETINLGGGMGCTATIAGGAGGGLFLFSSIIKGSKNRGAQSRFVEAQRTYPTTLKTWQDTERRKFADGNPDVRQALADQQTKVSQTQAENSQIRARNQNLPQPEINIRDMNLTGAMSPAQAGSASVDVSADVDARVPSAGSPNPDAVAIVIGNRDYRGLSRADHAVRDARSMQRYLVEAFGFAADRVVLDTNASMSRMNELFGSASDASSSRLAELVAQKAPGSVDVFVFYSGYGAPEGKPSKRYLLPVDANPRRLGTTGYALDVLYKNLTALKARSVTLAIDAGFGTLQESGAATQNQSFGGAIEVEVGTVGGANAQVFLATSADQNARVRRDMGHGLFTYFFLKGIQGSADANGDRSITASELETYVKANVRTYASDRMAGAQQSPEVFTNNPSRVVVTSRN
jgi:uncharacterized caspase-like protein